MRNKLRLGCLVWLLLGSFGMRATAQTLVHNIGVDENWWTWVLTLGIQDGYIVDDVNQQYNSIIGWERSPNVPNNPLTDVALQVCTSGNPNFNNQSYPSGLQDGAVYCPPGSLAAYDENLGSSNVPTSLSFSTGFTVMLVAYVDTFRDVHGDAMTYMHMTDSATRTAYGGNGQIAIGRNGTRWGLARIDPQTHGKMAWEFPWDSQVADKTFQLVFYTFTPDGKARIDVFNASSKQDWEAALLDMGMPVSNLTSGTPTTQPAAPTTATLGYIGFGNEFDSRYLTPVSEGTGFLNLSAWNSPLTQNQIYYYAQRVMGNVNASLSSNILPCNTGYMVVPAGKNPPNGTPYGDNYNGQYTTPANLCNYTSNWTRYNTGALTVAPDTLNVPYDQLSQTNNTPQTVTLTNTKNAAVAVTNLRITGNASYYIMTSTCTGWVSPNASCTITLGYGNNCPAFQNGTITVSYIDGNGNVIAPLVFPWQTVSNSTGCSQNPPNPSLSPSSLAFRDESGNDGPTAVTLTNNYTNPTVGPLSFQSISFIGTGAQDFSQTNNCTSPLAPGASCTINVTYLPPDDGTDSASLTINGVNTSAGSLSIPVSGHSD